eukprot:TRINITY_DN15724_c0_g1_i2.p1 TRINITY_DN15724_c0_g1~~TRINITY_DN15724_c0_g1_i2.p1  ORF type:complete len:239 (-),score=65.89 TRINITY_DN15724_c0_g1_i2:85-801(-)
MCIRDRAGMDLVREIPAIRLSIDKQLAALAECPSATEATQINTSIQEDLCTYDSKMQELLEEAETADREADRKALHQRRSELAAEGQGLRGALRLANQRCQESIRKETEKQRTELLSGDGVALQRRRAQAHRSALEGFGEATEGLQRARQMMSSELDQSSDTLMQMEKSSAVLRATVKAHGTLGGNADHGKRLLSLFQRRQLTDKVLTLFGLVVFMATCLYVVYKLSLIHISEPTRPY